MTTAGKIRVLLVLLFASLLITAIIVEKTYSPVNNLAQTAQTLENNLHKKEAAVYDVINNRPALTQLKSLQNKPADAARYIDAFTVNNSIWFITTTNNKISFWSGIKIIPKNLGAIKNGCSFLKDVNGYYEVIKKTDGNFSAVFFILVKNNYPFENKYLQNIFNKDLTTDNNIEIADFTDHGIYAVHDVNNSYLFSVKLVPGKVNDRFFYFKLTLWLLALFSLCLLIHTVIRYIARKKYIWLSLFTLAVFIVITRFINLHYGWPAILHELQIFNPVYYASSYTYPSLGDFCINVLAITWFAIFAYTQRDNLIKNTPKKFLAYIIFLSCLFVLYLTGTGIINLFHGLVINSKINFDVNNVLNLSGYSMIGVLMLCFSYLVYILLIEVVLSVNFKLGIPLRHQSAIFLAAVFVITALAIWHQEFTVYYLLLSVIIAVRAYAYLYNDKKFSAPSFLGIVLLCAIVSAVKLNQFENEKEDDTRKLLIQRLEVPDDVTADVLFKQIDKEIIADPVILKYYAGRNHNTNYLKVRLKKLYFDRYLSKYDFDVHEFDDHDAPISGGGVYPLDVFKDMVLYSSFKVSNYFYRENESFGFQRYFAILPIIVEGKSLGTIVIELKSKPLLTADTFPELLIDREIAKEDEFKSYSYAFYTDDKLIGQSGNYVYSVVNTSFKGKLKNYIEVPDNGDYANWYTKFTAYSHLLYKPTNRNLIVVSKEESDLLDGVTALTFFFVSILAFGSIAVMVRTLWLRVKIINFDNDRLKWKLKLNADRILYKTRIQFSMMFAVVVTLLLVGFITFVSISTQYHLQQDNLIRSKAIQIAADFERGTIQNYTSNISEEARVNFDELAKIYSSDLTLFNLNGTPVITTQPKIYDYGLLGRRMNARAFIALYTQKKSEYINEEKIGGLTYKAAYLPLRNSRHETLAYLQLPYFSNEADYNERIGSLLNIMINVYAFVFVAIGLFAVVIARQITAPLNFIQYNLSKTIYGKKNEPIKWERNDEIGALVKEYNNMIAALENSAKKLAQSERESAWREMAKQVAHEIKNPLTPLKLGLQLLDKSWKDKDPKFDQKFERFSKSFVEQIESLSSIASEFSAFAKMPDTRIETISIFEMLGQAVTIFKHMDNVKISMDMPATPFYVSADRDQLLRCFNNLLKNAIEATPEDRECLIQIDYILTTKNVLLTIKDNGNGIPENMREKIFEPNFTTKSSGTGLGLAFVRNSVENANGKVWFETALGAGTTFYLNFPAAEA